MSAEHLPQAPEGVQLCIGADTWIQPEVAYQGMDGDAHVWFALIEVPNDADAPVVTEMRVATLPAHAHLGIRVVRVR